jgi:hypothetical protein
MMRFSRLLVLSAGPFLWAMVSGCTFSAPQFESAIVLAQGIIASDDSKSADEPATWFASVDGVGAVLNPYVSNDLIVFANTDGDAIAFDGWTIRSVVGFGLKEPLSVSGKDGVRTFMVAGQKTQTQCDEWSLAELIWTQTCSNGPGEIVLDDEGNIQKITMPVFDGSAIVTLRVAK